MRPPRALWVPFDLGRPFGAPNEPAFQRDVLRTVLALFERTDGPVILDDFAIDAPGQGQPENMDGMVCPIPLKKPPPDMAGEADLIRQVLAEVEQLAPWQALFSEEKNRSATTIGISGMPLAHAISFLGDLLEHGRSDLVADDKWGDTLRFAAQDLRNYYLEAAAMRPGGPATHAAMIKWFWQETSAGSLLLALHPVCSASANQRLSEAARSQLIPRRQQSLLGRNP
jgi:hypothetical protein